MGVRKIVRKISIDKNGVNDFYSMYFILEDADFLFSVLLSLRLLFRGVSRFPGFLYNPRFMYQKTCFVCQNPVLPWFLRAVLRVVHDGEGGGLLGGVEASLASYVS